MRLPLEKARQALTATRWRRFGQKLRANLRPCKENDLRATQHRAPIRHWRLAGRLWARIIRRIL